MKYLRTFLQVSKSKGVVRGFQYVLRNTGLEKYKFKKMLPNLSAQAQKFEISMKKSLHWASLVRDFMPVQNIFLAK